MPKYSRNIKEISWYNFLNEEMKKFLNFKRKINDLMLYSRILDKIE